MSAIRNTVMNAWPPPFPKEHGVWAMMYVSFTVGVVIAGSRNPVIYPTAVGLFFLLTLKAPLTAFLRKLDGVSAFWTAVYGTLAGLLMLPALFDMPRGLPYLALAVMVPAVPVYLWALASRKEMKIHFEAVAMALLSLAGPWGYASAGGNDTTAMIALWAFLVVFYVPSSFRVRFSPSSRHLKTGAVLTSILLVTIGTAALAGALSWLIVLAYLPLLEDLWRAMNPRKEPISLLGRIELAKTLWFAVFLTLSLRP